MKKIILTLAFAALLISCKEETKDKLEDATDAVAAEVVEAVDSAKVKTETMVDSAKTEVKDKLEDVVEKGAEKVGNAADKVKEAVKK
jgi:F0F1-type ATP synthase membrane subunit b/b'